MLSHSSLSERCCRDDDEDDEDEAKATKRTKRTKAALVVVVRYTKREMQQPDDDLYYY